MKKLLHLTITEPLAPEAQAILDAQKKDASVTVETVRLTTENAPAVLEKIFEVDSICVWPDSGPSA